MHSIRNELQVALLFDKTGSVDIELLLANFLKIEKNERGYKYNVIEADGRLFARCFGGSNKNVMVFIEQVDGPADAALFSNAMQSPFNRMVTPDIDERVKRHRCHLLISVQHGAIPASAFSATPEISKMMQDVGLPQDGQTVPEFQERLRVLGLLTALVVETSKPTLGHWTHSETLADPQKVKEFILDPGPSPLNVHPALQKYPGKSDDDIVVGTTTVGARNFIGGEIDIKPSTLPWADTYQHALAFIRFAMSEDGYIIPDGDTFGTDDEAFCYRVTHLPGGDSKTPLYQLKPLYNKEHGFQSPDFIPPDVKLDLEKPQPEFVDTGSREGQALIAQMRAKQRMAQQAGVQFQVKIDPEKIKAPPAKGGSLVAKLGIGAKPGSRSPAILLLAVLVVALIYMFRSKIPF